MPGAAQDFPSSPISPTYSSSDRASAASGYFPRSRASSSDTSHSSQPSVGNRSNPARDDAPSGDVTPSPNAFTPSTGPVASGHAKVPAAGVSPSLTVDVRARGDDLSLRRGPTPTTAHLSPSPVRAFARQPQSQLDALKAHGQIVPDHIAALQTDICNDMVHLSSDIKKDISRVEDKVDDQSRRLTTVEDTLKDIQRNQDDSRTTLDSILKAVTHDVPVRQQGAVDSGQALVVDETTLKRLLADAIADVEQRLDATSAKRLAALRDEMVRAELKDEIATQIRAELGGEMTLHSLATSAVERNQYETVLEYLSELSAVVYSLQDTIPNLPAADPVAASAVALAPSPDLADPDPVVPGPAPGRSIGASARNSTRVLSVVTPGPTGAPIDEAGRVRLLGREMMRLVGLVRRELGLN